MDWVAVSWVPSGAMDAAALGALWRACLADAASLDRFKNDFNADFNFNVAFNFNDFNGTNDCSLAKIGLDTAEHDAPKSLTFHFRNFRLSNPI